MVLHYVYYGVHSSPARWLFILAVLLYVIWMLVPLTRIGRK